MKKTKILIGLTVLVFSLSNCKAQKSNNDLSGFELKGHVKSMIETECDVTEKFNEIQKVNVKYKTGYSLMKKVIN